MPRSESLNAHKGRALAAIDAVASDARRTHLTTGFGQDLVYQKKLSQAEAYLAAHLLNALTPVPPYVAAEAAAWGVSALVAAQAVLDAAEAFHTGAGPDIEQARMEGKIAVRAAETVEGVATALAAATAAINALT